MDINATRLTSLLKEALTPQPVPSAKADPAITALVKALVQPPAPAVAPSAQVAAQSLQGSLPGPSAQLPMRLTSTEIEDAYRAVLEPDVVVDEARPTATARSTAEADQASHGFVPAQLAVPDRVTSVAAAPLSSSVAAAGSAALVAANSNAPRRGANVPRGYAPRSGLGKAPLWKMSIVTAALSAALATIVVLLLR